MNYVRVKYEVFCSNCDKKSFVIKAEIDGAKSSIAGPGVEHANLSATSVSRRRQAIIDSASICECGSILIETGNVVGYCDQTFG